MPSDEEWALAAPYIAPLREEAGQRGHPLRAVFNGLRYSARTGVPWRSMPDDLPPWEAVYGPAARWLRAECFGVLAQNLPFIAGRVPQPRSQSRPVEVTCCCPRRRYEPAGSAPR